MSMFGNFIAALVAATSSFSASVVDMPLSEGFPVVQDYLQDGVDASAEIAQKSSYIAGITVIDRANGNALRFNDQLSHTPFEMQTVGRLPILLYAVLKDEAVTRGDVPEIVSMMQGYSGADTDAMWAKYGGKSIITELATRYRLEEFEAGDSWKDSKISSFDLARLMRRFLDDSSIDAASKQWVISMLQGTSKSVAGQDFSWGFASQKVASYTQGSVSQDGSDTTDYVAWVQGWSDSGTDPMVRSSIAVLGQDMRYIAVVHGNFPSKTPNEVADKTLSEIAATIVDDVNSEISDKKKRESDMKAKRFFVSQAKEFGEFVALPSQVDEVIKHDDRFRSSSSSSSSSTTTTSKSSGTTVEKKSKTKKSEKKSDKKDVKKTTTSKSSSSSSSSSESSSSSTEESSNEGVLKL